MTMKMLRRILLIALAIAAAMFLYILALGSTPYWTDMRAHAKVYDSYPNELIKTDLGTRYTISYFDHTAYVTFDENRQVVEADGITPIDFDRKNFWGLWSYQDFVDTYGGSHYYIGNSSEAWVTDDGYVIAMWMPGEWFYPFPFQVGNLAGEVHMIDLLAHQE